MALPSLEHILECIPERNRHRLDLKLDNRRERVSIARSLTNWKTIAQYIPNIQDDIDSIESDNSNLELRKIALLEMWVERNGHLATYRQLAKRLYDAKAINSLDVLCMELGAPDQNTVTSTSHQQTSQSQSPDHPTAQAHTLPEPILRELMTLISTDRPYDLGVHLNVKGSSLDLVRANHPGDHGRQLTEVFNLYLKQANDASWIEVAKALIAIDDIKTAKTIMKKFGFTIESSEPTNTSTPLPPTMTTKTPSSRKPSPDIPKPEPEPFVNKRLGLLLIAGLICAIGVYIAYNGNDNMLPGPVKAPTERSSPHVKSSSSTANQATMGRDTPQYRAVLDNLDRLVRNIRGLPEAENHLQRQFREKEWIDITSQVNADELTSLALTKIEMNAENYKVFIDMLNSVTGLQEIVARIRRSERV